MRTLASAHGCWAKHETDQEAQRRPEWRRSLKRHCHWRTSRGRNAKTTIYTDQNFPAIAAQLLTNMRAPVTTARDVGFAFKIRLLGKFSVQRNECELESFPSAKAKELFCYLLLHRDRSHSREVLASLLWGDFPTSQSKKYFRQTLWQLQQALHGHLPENSTRLLRVDDESLRLDSQPRLWLDSAVFEQAFIPVRGVAGEQLNEQQASGLHDAVSLYKGDLLEGHYQDWCLYHRERLQNIYTAMLDKLMGYCEVHRKFEAGMAHGESLLQQDQACERTYYRLIRLHYLAGDRAGALRQFHRCEIALRKELGVLPSRRTLELYNQVRTDKLETDSDAPGQLRESSAREISQSPVLSHLRAIRSLLLKVRYRLDIEVREVDRALAANSHPPDTGSH
jgi:DNA-binding SARP family transcriptional activator